MSVGPVDCSCVPARRSTRVRGSRTGRFARTRWSAPRRQTSFCGGWEALALRYPARATPLTVFRRVARLWAHRVAARRGPERQKPLHPPARRYPLPFGRRRQRFCRASKHQLSPTKMWNHLGRRVGAKALRTSPSRTAYLSFATSTAGLTMIARSARGSRASRLPSANPCSPPRCSVLRRNRRGKRRRPLVQHASPTASARIRCRRTRASSEEKP
mmetsp:Transcript_74079/g.205831  ORF Transcript_74079/g.205831 Transcript_74079/m.205831 type:complete len:215 (-) Transcript_74079:698-1342(-)